MEPSYFGRPRTRKTILEDQKSFRVRNRPRLDDPVLEKEFQKTEKTFRVWNRPFLDGPVLEKTILEYQKTFRMWSRPFSRRYHTRNKCLRRPEHISNVEPSFFGRSHPRDVLWRQKKTYLFEFKRDNTKLKEK